MLDKDDWPSHLDQACRNALIFEHKDVKFFTPRHKKPKAPDTAHVSIEEVGRNLIKGVDGVRTLIPPGFIRLAPKMETNQTLAELTDLLGAQCSPVDQEDAAAVERDVIHVLRLTGPMAGLKHLRLGPAGRSLISPVEALEAVFKDWKTFLGRFTKPTLLAPEEGWQAKFDNSLVNLPSTAGGAAKDLGFQTIQKRAAWINLVQRRNSQPTTPADQWRERSTHWKSLLRAIDQIRPSSFPWTVFAPPTSQGE